ncbi:MAG: hypothetical protein ACI828_001627 [Flavobacteriales bacterium]
MGKDRKSINGIWQEGPTTFSLKLTPLLKEIDYTNSKKVNTVSLDLRFESAHLNFYSKKEDTGVLDKMSKPLESNYLRITTDFQTNFESKIDVLIYPDVTSFYTAINVPEASEYMVGAASRNELKW